MSAPRILFVSREPIVHQLGGSTTYALSLLALLRAHGCDVTLLVTTARSRSPRLWFRCRAALPAGVRFVVPGALRLGPWYVQPFNVGAWMRFGMRLAERFPALAFLRAPLAAMGADRCTVLAWDLTPPTAGERQLALRYVAETGAGTVIGNYAPWGTLFDAPALRTLRCCLLLHDLLSERVERFRADGHALDCPPITRAEEFGWLRAADCLLAAQETEAATVRAGLAAMAGAGAPPGRRAEVVVQPFVLAPEPLPAAEQSAPADVQSGRVLFVGSNILPNVTALRWLLDEVWPAVRQAVPTAQLAVAGTVCAAFAAEPAAGPAAGVELLGRVPSMAVEYARAAVAAVPLRVGSGIKIKLVEALVYGKAIVSTSTGVQGLESWAHEAVRVADDAPGFAAAIVTLLTDDAARAAAQTAAATLGARHFGPEQPLPAEFRRAVLGEELQAVTTAPNGHAAARVGTADTAPPYAGAL